ncbi:MAG: LD-carboxypeptidase, partial [Bdellovibrionales bacterium]|nr:LD-carboxypeptidase [Bdellovibrionales bacterium]
MKKWSPLKKGDIVDLVAPGSACSQEELKKSVQKLKQMGYVPRVPKSFFSGHQLFSNTDAKRFEVLKKALYAKDSQGIWCVRGGYGSLRLLPLLSRLKKPARSKFVLGYSDITTIHHFLNTRWGWPTLHGPLFDRLGNGKMSKMQTLELENILTGKTKKIQFKNL